MTLPTSNELADRLLAASDTAAELSNEHWQSWSRAQVARFNRDLALAQAKSDAYANGGIDGKNAEQRAAQLDAILMGNQRLASHEDDLRYADSESRRAEGLLELARVHRSALHALVTLRVAELGCEAAKRKESYIESFYKWR